MTLDMNLRRIKRRNKILVGVIISLVVLFSVCVGVGYHLMSQNAFLGAAFDNKPLAVLEAASRIAWNQVTSTPTKLYDVEMAEKEYNKTVPFPGNPLELETAEQIIEWSVVHQSQPWVQNIPALLHESPIPVSNVVIHFVFLETQSGATPVMTLTYLSLNNTQIVEKGWKDLVDYTSYKVLSTDVFAVALLGYHGDSKLVVKAIIQNYDGAMKLITE
jgi:hypothetical protein